MDHWNSNFLEVVNQHHNVIKIEAADLDSNGPNRTDNHAELHVCPNLGQGYHTWLSV